MPILAKAIALIKTVATGNDPPTIKALEVNLGLAHSTCYRIVQTLVDEEWLRPLPGGRFALSAGLLPLLEPLAGYKLLIDLVRSRMANLSAETGLLVKLSVRQGNFANTLFRVESPLPASVSTRVGASFHLAYGSSGAILLSELPERQRAAIVATAPPECWQYQTPADLAARLAEFKRTGACSDLGHFHPNYHAVSAALRGRGGHVVAAVTIVGFPQAIKSAIVPDLKKALLRCTAALQHTLKESNYRADA